VNIDGTITGDLIAFARQVNIQGSVQGNVIAFALKLDFGGNIDGDFLAAGQTILADGRIGKNFWGLGSTLTLGRGIKLDNDAMLVSSSAYINGEVGRDAAVYSGTLDVGSKVGRDLRFSGGGLIIHPSSVIGRNLNCKTNSDEQVHIDPSVTIGGKKNLEIEKPPASQYLTFGFYTKQALRIVGSFLMGLLLYWIFPRIRRISLSAARALLTSCGIGFLIAVAVPVAAIIMAITLIGIPIALVAIALWLLGLYLAKIVIAKFVGSAILGARADRFSTTALALIIGLVIVIVAVNLPYIGGVLNFVFMLIGLGALARTIYRAPAAISPQS
jgi:cytoskeletal protein CcmA (bactofilin family)